MFAVNDVVNPGPSYLESGFFLDKEGMKADMDWDYISDAEEELPEEEYFQSTKSRRRRRSVCTQEYKSSMSSFPVFNQSPNHLLYERPQKKRRPNDFVRYTRCQRHPMLARYCFNIKKYEDPVVFTFPVADIVKDNLLPLLCGNEVYGIYLNLQWNWCDIDHQVTKTSWRILQDMKYPDSLIKNGLLFVYIPKFLFHGAFKVMQSKGFRWVEQAIVVPRDLGDTIVKKSRYLNVAKMCLHIFRKGAEKIPMKHQRTADVHLLSGEHKMFYTYNLIERLLPPSLNGRNDVRLLELYQVGEKRDKWIQIRHKDRNK